MEKEIIQGILRTNPRGFGFVIVKDKKMKDVFIPKLDIKNAIDGDLVEVEIKQISIKGPEGKILKILKREKSHFAGIICSKLHKDYIAFVPILGSDWPVIVKSKKPLNIGDRIILKVLDWEDKNGKTICELFKYLSHISEASKDVEAAAIAFNIKEEFSKDALEELKKLTITKNDLLERKDLTKLNSVTIDPIGSKDYDDAVSIYKDANNHYHLGVHIADVAHFVKPNTDLDKEAAIRANSTYFPGICIPMLPQKLSNNLCSLVEDQIRLTVSVLIEFNPSGDLLSYEIVRSFITNKKRLTYEKAKEILDSSKKQKHKKDLHEMMELCHLLKRKRVERGSIDFALPEARIIVDQQGVPLKIETVEYDITHQMIEEFMLKANELVATHLDNLDKKLIYRIHESPSYDTFKYFYELAKSLGFKLPANPDLKDLQDLFIKAKNTRYLYLLSLGFIKNLKLAFYSPENIGHFGLSLTHYTHFTSPIRRYVDLIIQRILFNEEDENVNLDEIAHICSEKERNSFKAEMSVTTLKKLRLLKAIIKKDPHKIFKATITKVRHFGIFFELDGYFLEGFIHVSGIKNDYYVFSQETFTLVGSRTGKTLSFADKIKVSISNIDLILLESQYRFIKKD
jgi:ribonuclease R